MSDLFAISGIEVGRLNALVKNIMDQTEVKDPKEAIRLVNSGEWVVRPVARHWREEDGVVYFSVTSNGKTGEQWIEHLKELGFRVGDYAKSLLRSPGFKPTSGVTYEIAVFNDMFFKDKDRVTEKIRAEADRRNLAKPSAEVTCLIREKFSDKELLLAGLNWLIVMHEPIKDFDGDSSFLGAGYNDRGSWLSVHYDRPDKRWRRGNSFAFVVSLGVTL